MDEPNKLTGRPPLTEGKRTRKIDVRFTEEEYRKVEDLEKELGLTKTDLVRMKLLSSNAGILINAKALLAGIDAIGAELGRGGNNINQLAHYANILRLQAKLDPEVAVKFNDLLEQYISLQQTLQVSLRKILRALGKPAC